MSHVSSQKVRRKLKKLKKKTANYLPKVEHADVLLTCWSHENPFEIPSLGNNKESAWHLLNKSLSLKPSVLQLWLLVGFPSRLQTHHPPKRRTCCSSHCSCPFSASICVKIAPWEPEGDFTGKTGVQVILIHEKIPSSKDCIFVLKKIYQTPNSCWTIPQMLGISLETK